MEAAREGTSNQAVAVEMGPEAPGDSRRSWRWVAVAIAVSLCLASAAALLTWQVQGPNPSRGGRDLQHTLRQLAGSDTAAIHLDGEYKKEILPDSVLWRNNTNQAFYQGGLALEDNKIVIPWSGLYFVYSQASFRVDCKAHNPHEEGKVAHIGHSVERSSESVDYAWKSLMASTRAACRKTAHGSRVWHDAIYLGAVFNLMEGDILRSSPEKEALPSLVGNQGKTYFGAFAL